MAYLKANILDHLEDGELPAFFFEFLTEVKETKPSKNFIAVFFESLNLEDKADVDLLNQSLWSLFSLMVFDSVASTTSRTNTWEANLL